LHLYLYIVNDFKVDLIGYENAIMNQKDKQFELFSFIAKTTATLMGLLIAIVALIDRLNITNISNLLIWTFILLGISFSVSYISLIDVMDERKVSEYIFDLRLILPLIIMIFIGYILIQIGGVL